MIDATAILLKDTVKERKKQSKANSSQNCKTSQLTAEIVMYKIMAIGRK